MLVALEKALIYGQANVSNRDYEGDIRESGNTVKIASIGDVSIGDYVKNTDIDDPETLSDDEISLLIDQSKYFNFYVDSVDRAMERLRPRIQQRGYREEDVRPFVETVIYL